MTSEKPVIMIDMVIGPIYNYFENDIESRLYLTDGA